MTEPTTSINESTSPAAAEPALPAGGESTSSADTIRDVYRSLPPDEGDEPATTAAPVTAAEVDELAKALGIDLAGKAKWTARVPYSKVDKIVKEREAKAKADHEAAIAKFRQQIEQFDGLVARPDHLMAVLAQINPAYQRYAAPPPAPAPPERIETLADLQRVIDARVNQATKPFRDERQQRELLAASQARVQQQMADIQTWPGVKEHEAALNAAMSAELAAAKAEGRPLKPFDQLYRDVVVARLASDRGTVRRGVLEELQKQPHSTSVTRTGAPVADAAGPKSSRDIIADIARRLGD